jgi:hypothetical protein
MLNQFYQKSKALQIYGKKVIIQKNTSAHYATNFRTDYFDGCFLYYGGRP